MKFEDTNHAVIKHPGQGYTVVVYLSTGAFQANEELQFDGDSEAEAIAKATEHFSKLSTSAHLKKGSLYDLI
jgi:hypothetical protein